MYGLQDRKKSQIGAKQQSLLGVQRFNGLRWIREMKTTLKSQGWSMKSFLLVKLKTFLQVQPSIISYLEDHPRPCKWLVTMVYKSPEDRFVGPLPNGPK